jgi:hypothetical protein
MTEPIPALEYRQAEFRRKPSFAVLAILGVVFSLISVATNMLYLRDVVPRAFTGSSSAAGVRSMFFPAIVYQTGHLIACLFLFASAIAYLVRSRYLGGLLSLYVLISIVGTIVGWMAEFMVHYDTVSVPFRFIPMAFYRMGSFANLIFLAAMLILLRAPTVQRLIRLATGVEEEPLT